MMLFSENVNVNEDAPTVFVAFSWWWFTTMAETLMVNSSLVNLSLRCQWKAKTCNTKSKAHNGMWKVNAIGDGGVKKLITGLNGNRGLRSLDLGGEDEELILVLINNNDAKCTENSIESEGAYALCEFLEKTTTLTSLELACSKRWVKRVSAI